MEIWCLTGGAAVAAYTVQGDAGSGISAGLRRQIQDPVAGLNMQRAGIKALGAYPGHRVKKVSSCPWV